MVVNARNVRAGECGESLAIGPKQRHCDVGDAYGVLAIALPIAIRTNPIQAGRQFLFGNRCFAFKRLMCSEELSPVFRCLKRQ